MTKTIPFLAALAVSVQVCADSTDGDFPGMDFLLEGREVVDNISSRLRTEPSCRKIDFERRVLSGDIAEYFLEVPVGPECYEAVGIHRVVREIAPYVPAPAGRALMMAPGDIWDFRAAFLADREHNLPVFLAKNAVDVWGIDYRWTFVPAQTDDFSFMKDWGIATDAHDLGIALEIARRIRFATGHGFEKMLLLGWSRGGQIGYAYLNQETQKDPGRRHVRGFIPVDNFLKVQELDLQSSACTQYQANQARHDAGGYSMDTGALISEISTDAAIDPDGLSTMVPGLTNRQAALAIGSMTFMFFTPGSEPTPLYHFTGGSFNSQGLPTGLLYTSEETLFTLERRSAPYQPTQELIDGQAAVCGVADVAFDDHLAEINVPVFYVGADGGFGHAGIYTAMLLGSSDLTHHVVDLAPEEERLADVGHVDILTATDAEHLWWRPILAWIQRH